MTLWTPDGERPVGRTSDADPTQSEAAAPGSAAPGEDLSPEEEAQARQMAAELAEARAQLLEADVSVVIANHAMGLYELAAIHLTSDDVKLAQARLAIDALASLVDGLEGRLGENEEVLNEALSQLRMAYVQQAGSGSDSESESDPETGADTD